MQYNHLFFVLACLIYEKNVGIRCESPAITSTISRQDTKLHESINELDGMVSIFVELKHEELRFEGGRNRLTYSRVWRQSEPIVIMIRTRQNVCCTELNLTISNPIANADTLLALHAIHVITTQS